MPTFSLAQKHAELDQHNAQTMLRIARETSTEDTRLYKTTAAGDEHKLRGIPCIARSVPGHIPGTRP